jgi:hypothetical protein
MTHKFKTAGKYACLVRPDRTELYEVGVINAYLVDTPQNRTGDSPLDATITDEGIVWAIYPDGEIIKSSWDMEFVDYFRPFVDKDLTNPMIESATAPDGAVVVAALGGNYCYVFRDGVEGRFAARDYSKMTISPDGKYVAVWGKALDSRLVYLANVRVYSTEAHLFVAQYDTPALSDLQFSKDGEYLLMSELGDKKGKARLGVEKIFDPSYSRSWLTFSYFPLEVCDLGSSGVLVAPSEKPSNSSPQETKPLALLPPLNQRQKDCCTEARYYPREVVPAKLPLHSLQLGTLGENKVSSIVYGMEGESIVKIGYAGDKFEPDFERLEVVS